MKTLLLFSVLTLSQAYAQVCPDLQGEYHCLVKPGLYSRLKLTQTTEAGVTTYIFDYLSVPGDAEHVPASAHGEAGEFGWYTKCKDNRLLSIPGGMENMLSEIYQDQKGDLIRSLNGKILSKCFNVKND